MRRLERSLFAFVTLGALGALATVLVGCGSAIFGAGGVDSFTFDDKPYFDGCKFEESRGVSSWNCSDASQGRIVEYRPCPTCGQKHEDAVAAFLASHPERGPVSKRERTTIRFTSAGDDVETPVSLLQQKGKLSFVASGPSPKSTAPSRVPFFVACTIDAKEEVEGTSEIVAVAVGTATCTKRMKGVLGVIDRYHP